MLVTVPAIAADREIAEIDSSLLRARWPEYRGPDASGRVPEATPPVRWSETAETMSENIVWKRPTEGLGWSTPVVWDGTAWFTAATEQGHAMWVVAIDLRSGETLWRTDLFQNEQLDEKHALNSFASPSPVTDGQHVWVHFGSYGTACLDAATGEIIWNRRDLPCDHWRGPGSSPILHGDNLIVHFDGFDFQYIIALDRLSGKTAWKQDRDIDYGTDNGDFFKAFSTPLVIEVAGNKQLISATSKAVLALHPDTGEEIWRVRFEEFSATARPLWDGTTLYINTGFGKAKLYAIDPDGQGDTTNTHVRWINTTSIGSKPSQLVYDGCVYNVHDSGVATCIDAATGETIWKERLGGQFSASIILAGGHLYLCDQDGITFVLEPGREFKQVAQNTLVDGCMASPVALSDYLLLRTRSAIYLIGPDAG
jgi:outer membrane protein assembly factor BamB